MERQQGTRLRDWVKGDQKIGSLVLRQSVFWKWESENIKSCWLRVAIYIWKEIKNGWNHARVWELRWGEAQGKPQQEGSGRQPHWLERAFPEGRTQKSHQRVRIRTSQRGSSLSDSSGPSRTGYSVPGQVRYGQNCCLCDFHPQPGSSSCWGWGIRDSPGHHHLPY